MCIYVYTNYVSMLVGWCHVRTVKQCLLIRAQPEECEYVGQYVNGCEQVNYHTHTLHECIALRIFLVCLYVCRLWLQFVCLCWLQALHVQFLWQQSAAVKLLDSMFMISKFLGAACGSPYIVFILRPSYGFMLRIYVYIYIY